ncbi:MAG: hypothetical protein ABIP90_07850 [Vicinamibacterales bacterium]
MTPRTLLSAVFVAVAFAAWPLIGRESRVSGAWMATGVMIGSALTVALLSSSQLAQVPAGRALWVLCAAAVVNGLAVFVYASSAADPLVPAGPFIVVVSVLQVAAVALIAWVMPGGRAPSFREAAGFAFAAVAVYLLAKG